MRFTYKFKRGIVRYLLLADRLLLIGSAYFLELEIYLSIMRLYISKMFAFPAC